MTTHVSGPCCDSDIEPGQCKGAFLWDDPDQDQWSEVTRIMVDQMNRWILVQNGFIASFDIPRSEWSRITDPRPDHPKETKSSLVSITHILKIINTCQENVKPGKNCTDEWFYFLCGVIPVGKVMLRYFTKKCIESRLFIKWSISLSL